MMNLVNQRRGMLVFIYACMYVLIFTILTYNNQTAINTEKRKKRIIIFMIVYKFPKFIKALMNL